MIETQDANCTWIRQVRVALRFPRFPSQATEADVISLLDEFTDRLYEMTSGGFTEWVGDDLVATLRLLSPISSDEMLDCELTELLRRTEHSLRTAITLGEFATVVSINFLHDSS